MFPLAASNILSISSSVFEDKGSFLDFVVWCLKSWVWIGILFPSWESFVMALLKIYSMSLEQDSFSSMPIIHKICLFRMLYYLGIFMGTF